MIPLRARRWLLGFIHDHHIARGERAGMRIVNLSRAVKTNAGHVRALDLRMLERKGLITYELDQRFTDLFGVMTWDVKLTDAGAEEIEDDYAKRKAQADIANEDRAKAPDPFGDERDLVEDDRAETAERSEARARQRAAKVEHE